MGGDGGSISQRSEMVKTRKKAAKEVDPTDEAISAWTSCSMTAEALRRPVVVCEMGRLYNKSSVLAHLLALKSKDPNTPKPAYAFSHIKSMKHVTEAKLHYDDESKVGKGSDPHFPVPFSCPITGIPGNGKRRFVMIHGCGCVMSEKAIEQVPSTVCLICGRQLKNGQIVLDKRFSTEESAIAMGISSSSGSSAAAAAAAAEEVGTVGAGAEKKVPKVTPQDLEREYTPILPADPRESDLLREILLAKRAQAKSEKASGKKRGREGKEEAGAGGDEQKGEAAEGGEQRPSKRSKKEKEQEKKRREEEWKEAQERQKEWRSLKEKPIKELAAAVEQAVSEKMRSSAFAELFTSDKDRVGLTPNLTGAGIAHKPRR